LAVRLSAVYFSPNLHAQIDNSFKTGPEILQAIFLKMDNLGLIDGLAFCSNEELINRTEVISVEFLKFSLTLLFTLLNDMLF
jgi:hypothetical protein